MTKASQSLSHDTVDIRPTSYGYGDGTEYAAAGDANAIIENLPIGIFVLDVDTQRRVSCRIANRHFEKLIGKPAHVSYDHFFRAPEISGQISVCLSEERAVRFEWTRKNDLDPLHFDCEVIPQFGAGGDVISLLGTVTDRTKERRAENHMLHQALHDHLTSLPNRAFFDDVLEKAETRRKTQEGYEFAVMLLNVDRLQSVNDTLGHLTGDELLVSLARRIQSCLGPQDMVARMGGDEFAIFVGGYKDSKEINDFAARIHKILEDPFNLSTVEVYASLSIGIAVSEGYKHPAEETPRDADLAMHRAKASGRGRTVAFQPDRHTPTRSRLHLETNLRKALEEKQFALDYQPIICLETGRIRALEALVRWHHPKHGLLPPSQFVPLAEETGMIVLLGRWAMDEACRQLGEWRKAHGDRAPETMCVNVSTIQLMREEFVGEVLETLRRHDLPPKCLKVEVTESLLMENPETAATLLAELRAAGVTLAMDDFGTGHSSLSYIQKFPFDVLKIDRSFVSEMIQSAGSDQIVQIITSLAHTLNFELVAEGIETQAQLRRLKELGCQYGQGFYFSPPIVAADVGNFLETRTPLDVD